MRFIAFLAAAAMASPVSAQITIRRTPGGFDSRGFTTAFGDGPRAVIGITTTGSATNRDTLGVLVSSVHAGSPADKAGIEEGNRIASVNGVSLKLAPGDVGEYEMAGAMNRRLTRELDKLKPGDEVELKVYAGGQTKTVKVKTIAPDDLYEMPARRSSNDRATIGVSLAMTGGARDSIGVFVMSVEENGPAAKAGIEEGARIASINGVDLRAKRMDDEQDVFGRTSNVSRLSRELAKVKPGDDVDLRVYVNGQYRNVKVKTVRAGDLPRRGRATYMINGDGFVTPPLPPMLERLSIDGPEIGSEIRRAFDRVPMSIALPRMGNRISW